MQSDLCSRAILDQIVTLREPQRMIADGLRYHKSSGQHWTLYILHHGALSS